jgi:hypothetical protein
MCGLRPETISARFRPSEFAKEECSSRVTALAVLGVGGVYPLAGSVRARAKIAAMSNMLTNLASARP